METILKLENRFLGIACLTQNGQTFKNRFGRILTYVLKQEHFQFQQSKKYLILEQTITFWRWVDISNIHLVVLSNAVLLKIKQIFEANPGRARYESVG